MQVHLTVRVSRYQQNPPGRQKSQTNPRRNRRQINQIQFPEHHAPQLFSGHADGPQHTVLRQPGQQRNPVYPVKYHHADQKNQPCQLRVQQIQTAPILPGGTFPDLILCNPQFLLKAGGLLLIIRPFREFQINQIFLLRLGAAGRRQSQKPVLFIGVNIRQNSGQQKFFFLSRVRIRQRNALIDRRLDAQIQQRPFLRRHFPFSLGKPPLQHRGHHGGGLPVISGHMHLLMIPLIQPALPLLHTHPGDFRVGGQRIHLLLRKSVNIAVRRGKFRLRLDTGNTEIRVNQRQQNRQQQKRQGKAEKNGRRILFIASQKPPGKTVLHHDSPPFTSRPSSIRTIRSAS